MTEQKYCPNCRQELLDGNYCETCDASFTIGRKDGPKIKQQGRIEQLERRIAALEDNQPAEPNQVPEKEPDEDIEAEPEAIQPENNNDNEIFPR